MIATGGMYPKHYFKVVLLYKLETGKSNDE